MAESARRSNGTWLRGLWLQGNRRLSWILELSLPFRILNIPQRIVSKVAPRRFRLSQLLSGGHRIHHDTG